MYWDHDTFFSALIAFPRNDAAGFLFISILGLSLKKAY
jgi:hypothetical protein